MKLKKCSTGSSSVTLSYVSFTTHTNRLSPSILIKRDVNYIINPYVCKYSPFLIDCRCMSVVSNSVLHIITNRYETSYGNY